jgi:hypothetical protein
MVVVFMIPIHLHLIDTKNQTNENCISDCYSCSWSSLWFDCTRNNQ